MAFNEFDNSPNKLMLSAINTMLNSIGEESIENEEDIDSLLETRMARDDLIDVKREVLDSEWDVNFDSNYSLPVDVNGYIPIPSNILRVYSTSGDLIIRNHLLYSKSAQSVRFTEAQTVNVVWDLSFNSIPQSLRKYITLKACRRFRDRVIGEDPTQHGYTQEDEIEARMEARRSEASSTNANMLDTMPSINGQ